MSRLRGIVTESKSTAARAISVTSTLPVALVLTSKEVTAGVYAFDSPEDAINSDKFSAHENGNLIKYLEIGANKFNVIVPTIISIASVDDDADTTKTNVVTAINALTGVAGVINLASSKESVVTFKPDIIGVGDYGDDADVRDALISVCNSTKARTFIDLKADTNADAITSRDTISSDRVTVAKCNLGSWNTTDSKTDMYDSGIVLCWLRAYIDGESKTGYSKSISNRVLPFSSVASPSKFYPGLKDETDSLTEKQIMSFIAYKGLRTWEYSTCSNDAMWQDARRVRIIDMASESVIDGIFYAVDRDLSALTSAKKTLKAFMSSLIGDEVMIGFDVYLDTKRTTPERIDAGEFYFVIEHQESPSPKLICVTFDRVNKFSNVVYKIIEEA
jgi:phage tail sheath protein FI